MTVTGTRPEFIQTSRLSHAIRRRHTEIFVNTGQHYDDAMSQVFFRELDIPTPDLNLNVGTEGASHAAQTGNAMMALEPVMTREKPDWVLVYGDTNTTVAGALVAAKLHIPIAHVEAGLRSFDRRMPEEVNRIIADHLGQLLLAPTEAAIANLTREGITEAVVNAGDVRVDILAAHLPAARARQPKLFGRIGVDGERPFLLATIHRASNTDDRARLTGIVDTLDALPWPVVLPLHPRLKKMMQSFDLSFRGSVVPVLPVGFLDMLSLLDACRAVVTDSGGLQKEAYLLERPCVTVRESTEWVETVTSGWNCLVDPGGVGKAVRNAVGAAPAEHPDFYGSPGVCDRIVTVLEQHLPK